MRSPPDVTPYLGKLVRFRVLTADGRRAEYDLDISPHAGAAVELAKVEAE